MIQTNVFVYDIVYYNKKKQNLDSSSTRDDLNQLSGNHSLSGAVVGQSQLVNHLTCKIKLEDQKI